MDRRRLKRQVLLWRILAIVLAVGVALAIAGRLAGTSGDYVARNLKCLSLEGRLVQIAFLKG